MLQQGKDLKDMSVIELKALVYDLLAQRQNIEGQIQQVNQLVVNKQNEPVVPKEAEPIKEPPK